MHKNRKMNKKEGQLDMKNDFLIAEWIRKEVEPPPG